MFMKVGLRCVILTMRSFLAAGMVYDCTVYGIGFCNHYSKPSRFEATQDPLVDGLFGEAIMYHHACVCPHTLGQTSVSSEFQLCNHGSNLPSCLDACFDDALFFFKHIPLECLKCTKKISVVSKSVIRHSVIYGSAGANHSTLICGP